MEPVNPVSSAALDKDRRRGWHQMGGGVRQGRGRAGKNKETGARGSGLVWFGLTGLASWAGCSRCVDAVWMRRLFQGGLGPRLWVMTDEVRPAARERWR